MYSASASMFRLVLQFMFVCNKKKNKKQPSAMRVKQLALSVSLIHSSPRFGSHTKSKRLTRGRAHSLTATVAGWRQHVSCVFDFLQNFLHLQLTLRESGLPQQYVVPGGCAVLIRTLLVLYVVCVGRMICMRWARASNPAVCTGE